jgi:hypothetical protein
MKTKYGRLRVIDDYWLPSKTFICEDCNTEHLTKDVKFMDYVAGKQYHAELCPKCYIKRERKEKLNKINIL